MGKRRNSQVELGFDSMTDLITNLAGGLVLLVLLLLGVTQPASSQTATSPTPKSAGKPDGGEKPAQPLRERILNLELQVKSIQQSSQQLEVRLRQLREEADQLLKTVSKVQLPTQPARPEQKQKEAMRVKYRPPLAREAPEEANTNVVLVGEDQRISFVDYEAAVNSLDAFISASKSAGTGTSFIQPPRFEQTGTTTVLTGTLVLAAGGRNSGNFQIAIDAMPQFTTGARVYTLADRTILVGGGVARVWDGTVAIEGEVIARTLVLDRGIINGRGTLRGIFEANGGVIRPGGDDAVGTFTVVGSYRQTDRLSASLLEIELASPTSYDQLVISSTMTLAGGNLRIRTLNSFVPPMATSYSVLTFGNRSGDFAGMTGLSFPNANPPRVLAPIYSATTLTLLTVPPGSGPTNWPSPRAVSAAHPDGAPGRTVGPRWVGPALPGLVLEARRR